MVISGITLVIGSKNSCGILLLLGVLINPSEKENLLPQ
jgi:hypothetical protein